MKKHFARKVDEFDCRECGKPRNESTLELLKWAKKVGTNRTRQDVAKEVSSLIMEQKSRFASYADAVHLANLVRERILGSENEKR